tara:strand:- start:1188 stop:1298 length:111 start_codon:yes stop_codon:yes gene_type:complete
MGMIANSTTPMIVVNENMLSNVLLITSEIMVVLFLG